MASVGVIIQDSRGLLGVAYFWKPPVSPPFVVKIWACLELLWFTKESGFWRVDFEGNSLLVITKMKSIVTDRSGINMLIWKTNLLVSKFQAYHSKHIHCLGNRAPHLMEKEGFH